MKNRMIRIIAAVALMVMMCGCKTAEAGDKSHHNEAAEVVVKTVNVTEQPLSAIHTAENDWFASNDNYSFQPYIDGKDGFYFYDSEEDTDQLFLCYSDGTHEPVKIKPGDNKEFEAKMIYNHTIYGIETDIEQQDFFIAKYENNTLTRMPNTDYFGDTEIIACYFAKEGIYYQEFDKIFLMDYESGQTKQIVTIPDELFYMEGLNRLVVYQGKMWYFCDKYEKNPYPLWCYDFNGTFTKFDKGGISAVCNGYLYYIDENKDNALYRFNCDTYSLELVSDSEYVESIAFFDNCVFYTGWDQSTDTAGLYRLNGKEKKRIMSPDELENSEGFMNVVCSQKRLFVTGYTALKNTCIAEIDMDGNIKDIIYRY